MIDLDLSKYDALSTRFVKEQAEVTDFLKSGIATRNAGFNRLIERIEQVALREADGGLLFLDEIGELGPDEQAMLLRALEDKTLSDAGREIFSISRNKRAVTNDADRLKKYLAKFSLGFDRL